MQLFAQLVTNGWVMRNQSVSLVLELCVGKCMCTYQTLHDAMQSYRAQPRSQHFRMYGFPRFPVMWANQQRRHCLISKDSHRLPFSAQPNNRHHQHPRSSCAPSRLHMHWARGRYGVGMVLIVLRYMIRRHHYQCISLIRSVPLPAMRAILS